MLKALGQWEADSEIREDFWRNPACDYRLTIDSAFGNYSRWLTSVSVPLANRTQGMLPGDFSATFEKGSVRCGIVGLNSAFLQVSDGDYRRKLDLHVSQLAAVCDRDPTQWTADRTLNLLLTHHPGSWLSARSEDHFRQEIYPPARFFGHLCGHLHEPDTHELSEAGAEPRRVRQAPSLFGLAHWGGAAAHQRSHGYNLGQFVFDDANSFERLWPRIAVKGRHGGLNLGPDITYQLKDGSSMITPFELRTEDHSHTVEGPVAEVASNSPAAIARPVARSAAAPHPELMDAPLDPAVASSRLAACPRFGGVAGPHHREIRRDEQSELEHHLRRTRCVWLVADWGMGQEGFLAAAFDRMQGAQPLESSVFHLRCEDVVDIDALEMIFPQQCGMGMLEFCGLIAPVENALLLMDGIDTSFCSGAALQRLNKITNAILDYCPKLRLVLVTRVAPQAPTFGVVALKPLDVPDVRTYLKYHPDATPDLRDADIVEKLHERSDGLPMHLDRMLKALNVSSLASVLASNIETPAAPWMAEETPRALTQVIANLQNSESRSSRRSARLLKVLTVLRYGETLDTLGHYLPAEPFFPQNALQLKDLALLDSIPLQTVALSPAQSRAQPSEAGSPKVLKVPRPVRDAVRPSISEEETSEIVLAGIDRYFGRHWREGRVRFRKVPIEYVDFIGGGVGNECALIHELLRLSRDGDANGIVDLGRSLDLAIQYATHLKNLSRYRDLSLVCTEFVAAIDRDVHPRPWHELAALLGEGLRMTGKADESLRWSRAALEASAEYLSNAQRANVLLDVALAEKKLGNKDAAILAAREIKEIGREGSGASLQADVIEAELSLTGAARIQALASLEDKARKQKQVTVAGNIALELAYQTTDTVEQLRHLERVLKADDTEYNLTRAIVAKAAALKSANLVIEKPDVTLLIRAYSYLHAQRSGSLFEQCHDSLWHVFEKATANTNLLRLFRHSSFLWRIRGNEKKEEDYVARLRTRDLPKLLPGAHGLGFELGYFWARVKAMIAGTSIAANSAT